VAASASAASASALWAASGGAGFFSLVLVQFVCALCNLCFEFLIFIKNRFISTNSKPRLKGQEKIRQVRKKSAAAQVTMAVSAAPS
jgi:hypothetical protein